MKRGVDVDIIYSNSPLLEMLNHHQYHQWIYTEWFTPQCQFPARPLQWQLIAFCQILLSLEYLWRYDDSVCSKYSQALNSSLKWKYLLMSYAQPHIVKAVHVLVSLHTFTDSIWLNLAETSNRLRNMCWESIDWLKRLRLTLLIAKSESKVCLTSKHSLVQYLAAVKFGDFNLFFHAVISHNNIISCVMLQYCKTIYVL